MAAIVPGACKLHVLLLLSPPAYASPMLDFIKNIATGTVIELPGGMSPPPVISLAHRRHLEIGNSANGSFLSLQNIPLHLETAQALPGIW